jgi:hypothetical protein
MRKSSEERQQQWFKEGFDPLFLLSSNWFFN